MGYLLDGQMVTGLRDLIKSQPAIYNRGQPLEYRAAPGEVGYFPVLVKQNNGGGNIDGDSTHYATWAYDLYALNDTSYVTKLNLVGVLQPKNSAARIVQASVTQAVDGSVGVAYYDADGAIQLYNCMELGPQTNCGDSEISDDDGTW